jgi:hypothetical protein
MPILDKQIEITRQMLQSSHSYCEKLSYDLERLLAIRREEREQAYEAKGEMVPYDDAQSEKLINWG